MTRQVRLTVDQYDEWQAKIMAQKQVRGDGLGETVRGEPMTDNRPFLKAKDAPSPYKSKLEAQYAAHLELLLKAGEIRRWAYEPMSLKLADGKRYRPDFLVVLPLGAEAKAEMHEVKGRWTKNRRDGMTHLKWAAQLYGDVFTFRMIEWKGHGFDGHYIT